MQGGLYWAGDEIAEVRGQIAELKAEQPKFIATGITGPTAIG
jgi:hypothetical protein